MQRVLLIILGAFLPALILPPMAQAATFVYDAGAGVAIPKTDYQVNPSIPSSQKIVAADWNQLGQAAYDLRQAILTGYFHGLTAQTATPPAPAFGIILYDMLDGGGLWAEFPDAGTEQVFDGLQQMDNLWVRARAGIDGGLTVGHGGVYATTGVISAGEVDFNNVYVFSAGSAVSLNGDAVDGATAVGVILNNDQALSTAGARIASFRNNNAVKAYVDYGGLGVFDGGVDLGVAGLLTAGASGVAVTSTPTDSVGHHAFSVNTTATLSGGADLVAVANNGSTEFSVGATGITKGFGGFNANSSKLIVLAAGTVATDGVNWSQIGPNSLAGQQNATNYSTLTPYACQFAGAAASQAVLTLVTLQAGTIAAGQCTDTIAAVDVTAANAVLCSKGMLVGAANTDTAIGSVETATCTGLTIAANDKICAEITSSTCTTARGIYSTQAAWK